MEGNLVEEELGDIACTYRSSMCEGLKKGAKTREEERNVNVLLAIPLPCV